MSGQPFRRGVIRSGLFVHTSITILFITYFPLFILVFSLRVNFANSKLCFAFAKLTKIMNIEYYHSRLRGCKAWRDSTGVYLSTSDLVRWDSGTYEYVYVRRGGKVLYLPARPANESSGLPTGVRLPTSSSLAL